MTEINIDNLKEEYEDLYNHWMDNGIPQHKAIEMLNALPDQDSLYQTNISDVSVQISFNIDWLEDNTDWMERDTKGKGYLLWQLGMDTKTKGYFQESRRVMVGTKQEYKEVVYGQERLDSDWITKTYPVDGGTNHLHYASQTALDYVWRKKHGQGGGV